LRVYFHIGIGKTGTTSLQRALDENFDRLLSRNVLYPRAGRQGQAAHHWLAILNTARPGPDQRALFDALDAELADTPATAAILSSEAFCYCRASYIEWLAQRFSAHDVRIVFYVRRQSELVASSFVEKVRMRAWPPTDFAGYYAFERDIGAWRYTRLIRPWEKHFGRGALMVRVYDRSLMREGDSVGDFLHLLGLAGLVDSSPRSNAAIADQLLPLVGAYDEIVGKDGAARRDFLDALARASADLAAEPIVDAEFARRIDDDHRADNEEFARRYLRRDQARALLSAPPP